MPELPEVENIVRSVRPCVIGRKITGVELLPNERDSSNGQTPLLVLSTPARTFRRGVCSATVEDVRRYGKNIVFHLRKENKENITTYLIIHLGMTGRLTCETTPEFQTKHTHVVFSLDEPGRWLHYTDVRQFGRLSLFDCQPAQIKQLGPDPLEISVNEFGDRLRSRRAMVKSLLLDQRFLRGLGNIYADESLFRAGVHPAALGAHVTRRRALRLHQAIQETLAQAIEFGGSSISNYVDGLGRAGRFQQLHQVYRRTGEPCFRCGALIQRMLLASRGTHFCPRCQRLPRRRSAANAASRKPGRSR